MTPEEAIENEMKLQMDDILYGQRMTDENGIRIDPTTVIIKTNKKTGKRIAKIIK